MKSAGEFKKSLYTAAVVGAAVALSHWHPDILQRVDYAISELLAAVASARSPAELPLKDMFIIFLSLFVAMGLVPFFEKIISRLHEHSRPRNEGDMSEPTQVQKGLESKHVEPAVEIELYDFEVIVLRLLAAAGWKGLSLAAIVSALHLEPDFVRKTLLSLEKSGLVTFVEIPLLGTYYFLTREGRRYSVRQGFLFGA